MAWPDFYHGDLEHRRGIFGVYAVWVPSQIVYLQFSLGNYTITGLNALKVIFLEPFALF